MINAGLVHKTIESHFPGVILGVSVSAEGVIYVNQWVDGAADTKKAEVNAFIASLDIALLEAQDLYAQRFAEFNKKTESIEAEGFAYDGGTFHADAKMIANIQSLMIGSSMLTYPQSLYDEDSSWTFTDAAAVIAMGAAVMSFVAGVRAAAKTERDALKQQVSETSASWLARLQAYVDPR